MAHSLVPVLLGQGQRRVLPLKRHPKNTQALDPIITSPFVVPTTIRKEAPTGNAPMGDSPLQAVTNYFPQTGGNRVTEAPEVVFDLTPGKKGVETSSPNDSLKASLSPSVGDRLNSFRRDWQTEKCSNNMLNIITNGYILPSIHQKTKISQSLPDSLRIQGPLKDLDLASCIQSLLSKNAIERAENLKSLGFYRHLFLIHKPHQRWRPVIDLSRLNTFLLVERFKMETPESIRASLIPGEWVSSIDLSDNYLHIPIHPNIRKFLLR